MAIPRKQVSSTAVQQRAPRPAPPPSHHHMNQGSRTTASRGSWWNRLGVKRHLDNSLFEPSSPSPKELTNGASTNRLRAPSYGSRNSRGREGGGNASTPGGWKVMTRTPHHRQERPRRTHQKRWRWSQSPLRWKTTPRYPPPSNALSRTRTSRRTNPEDRSSHGLGPSHPGELRTPTDIRISGTVRPAASCSGISGRYRWTERWTRKGPLFQLLSTGPYAVRLPRTA